LISLGSSRETKIVTFFIKVERFCTITTRQDKTRQDKTRQDKARQDKTRQDKTRQDKTRQDVLSCPAGTPNKRQAFVLSSVLSQKKTRQERQLQFEIGVNNTTFFRRTFHHC
jgi:hypothetical protein